MDRRKLIQSLGLGISAVLTGCSHLGNCEQDHHHSSILAPLDSDSKNYREFKFEAQDKKLVEKSLNFDQDFSDDIFLSSREILLVTIILRKMLSIQHFVGHGNFNVLTWDELLLYSRIQSGQQAFSKQEISFLEKLFYKVTFSFQNNSLVKVPYSGHYLLKDLSLPIYEKLRKEIGKNLLLTSGVRGVAKQFFLFLNKSLSLKGNLSRASRSIAPPGYSFHGKGDFDIGEIGLGEDNFTDKFSKTSTYQKLEKINQSIRYGRANLLGVRFEPWHIKV